MRENQKAAISTGKKSRARWERSCSLDGEGEIRCQVEVEDGLLGRPPLIAPFGEEVPT